MGFQGYIHILCSDKSILWSFDVSPQKINMIRGCGNHPCLEKTGGWTATISQISLSFFFPVREDESMSVDDNQFISNLK